MENHFANAAKVHTATTAYSTTNGRTVSSVGSHLTVGTASMSSV